MGRVVATVGTVVHSKPNIETLGKKIAISLLYF